MHDLSRLLCAALLFPAAAMAAETGSSGRVRVDISAKPWTAVGQVNNEAYGRCTGVLIARQIAVTAAHCLFNKGTQRFLPPNAIHFVLGYDRGTFAFQTVATSMRIGAGYDPKRPLETIRSDWALLDLAVPAPETIEPMTSAVDTPAPGSAFVSAGFGRDRAYALSAASACQYVSGYASGLIAVNCSIIQGYSGGPMVDAQGRLVGIQVAGGRREGHDVAFAVPSNAWQNELPAP